MATAQSRWAAKQVKRGRCRICGNRREHYKTLCDFHQKRFNTYMRDYRARHRKVKEPTNVPIDQAVPTPVPANPTDSLPSESGAGIESRPVQGE